MDNLDFNTKIKLIVVAYTVITAITFLTIIFFQKRHKKVSMTIQKGSLQATVTTLDKAKTIKMLILKFIIFGCLYTLIAAGVFIAIYATSIPKIIQSTPVQEAIWEDYSKPLEVKFNVPVQINKLKPTISPDTPGKWVWDHYLGLDDLTRSGKFYPDQTFLPDKRIVVYITGVSRLGYNFEDHELGLNIQSTSLPDIASTTPDNNAVSVKRDSNIIITLNKSDNHLAEWSFDLTPKVEYTISNPTSNTIELNPTTELDQSTKYILTIKRKSILYSFKDNKTIDYGDDPEKDTPISFITAKEPFIQNFLPQGNAVRDDSQIKVQFGLSMDRKSVQANMIISPTITGQFQWQDDSNMTFIPSTKLIRNTNYTVTFKTGTASKEEGIFTKDGVFSFQTVGPVKVDSFDPSNNSTRVRQNATISLLFNQDVDKASAQNNFKINPYMSGRFSWSANTMNFIPNDYYTNNVVYTVTELKGAKSIYGVDSTSDQSSSFRIIPAEIILSGIPLYYQPQPSDSCNIYAAKMALGWKGIYWSASTIIGKIGYDPGYNGWWTGDPYAKYVGNSDGSWGYGVYWGPIKNLLNNAGIRADIMSNWNTAGIANSIANGQPVIIWRYNGTSTPGAHNWWASDGRYVNGINGQHGGVIVGFRGPVNNPSQFLINDPWFGQIWMSASTFDSYWSQLGRMAVVVY